MAITGIFTNVGLTKAQEAATNRGYWIEPKSFGVSRIAGLLDPNRVAVNSGLWYTGLIAARTIISPNTVKFVCSIPAGLFPPGNQDVIREIYLWDNNDNLLCIGQSNIDIIYDPSAEIEFSLELSLANTDFSEELVFKFTQAEEVHQHNIDPNAHPEIVNAVSQAGIFFNDFHYWGQSFDIKAEFDGTQSTATHDGITFTAVYRGEDGNTISLVFDGINTTTDDAVLAWNNAHPNIPVMHSGMGNEILSAATVNLSGGTWNIDNLDAVYKDSDGIYKAAISDGTKKGKVVGIAFRENRIVRTFGYLDYPHAYPKSTVFYLSKTDAGKLSNEPSNSRVALALTNDVIFLNIDDGDIEDYPLRLYTATPPNSKLYIRANQIITHDGTTRSSFPINFSFTFIADSWIDFQAQTKSSAIEIEFPASTVGRYRRVFFTEIMGGKIRASFSDEVTLESELNGLGFLFMPGNPIGWVDVECTDASGKFKTIGSSLNIIENDVNGVSRIFRILAGGGAGEGEGGGVPAFPATGFKEVIYDTFTVPASTTDSTIKQTNAIYSQGLYKLLCDGSKTITITGNNFTLSSGIAWMKENDIVYINSLSAWAKIVTLNNQFSGTLDRSLNVTSTCMVSQALFTFDLINLGDATQKTRIRDTYGTQNINLIHVEYDDSLNSNDSIPDFNDAARIVVSGSNEGIINDVNYPTSDKFTTIFTRPTNPSEVPDYPLEANTNQERLFLVFFCNPDNSDVLNQGFANLLKYECSLVPDVPEYTGAFKNTAFAFSDNSVAPVNSYQPQVVNGKTRWTFKFSFIPNLNAGQTNGDIEIQVDGKVLPRYVSGITTDAWYKEINNNTIEFWADISGVNLSLQAIRKNIGIVNLVGVHAAGVWNAIVGSNDEVAQGIATHTSLQAAINDASHGDKIYLLHSVNENITISKSLVIEGSGAMQSNINGNVNIVGSRSYVSKVSFVGNLSVSGDYNFVFGWITSGSVNDTGLGNRLDIIEY